MTAPSPAPSDSPVRVPPDRTGIPPEPVRTGAAFRALCDTVARLRAPDGCPWDRVQTLATIKPHTLEETYELLEAIDRDDDGAIAEELGDVLLQVVLDAQIAADEGRFVLADVIDGLTGKLVSRHPHVFGTEKAETAADVLSHWDRVKRQEKRDRESALDGIPADLPQLARAARIAEKAARVGYDFPRREMLFDKLREELDELERELSPDGPLPRIPASIDGPRVPDEPVDDPARRDRIEDELGDVLFVLANIARRWQVNPEEALRRSNRKFAARFRQIERTLRERGRTPAESTLEEMEAAYQEAKRAEKRAAAAH